MSAKTMKTPKIPAQDGLMAVLRQFRREFITVGVFSAIVNLLMLTPTWYMLQVYDRVLHSMNLLTLVFASCIALFLFSLLAFSEWARSRLLVRVGVRLDQALSDRIFSSSFLRHLSPSEPDPTRPLTQLITLRQFMTGNGVFAFFDSPWVLIYIAVLGLLHPLLGVVALVFALLQTVVAWLGHRALNESVRESGQQQVAAQQFLAGKIRHVEVLNTMGMLPVLWKTWRDMYHHALIEAGRSQMRNGKISGISKFLRYAQQTMSLATGAWLVIHGEISPGGMIASNVLMSRALAPIDLLVISWPAFLQSREAFGQLNQLIRNEPAQVIEDLMDTPIGKLEAQGVIVRVPSRERPLLDAVSMSMLPGTITVVLGPSGSGKTTLAKVLIGIWPSFEGQVLLDSEPINRWSRASLGKHVGYLPQDVELFEGSIAENIARMGDVDSVQVIAAAEAAGLHGMILRMPKGYDTQVGAGGAFLSGGQRQRIALARAIYAEPVLVVLDEPNAHLDDEGERALTQSLLRLKQKGCTVVLVSHRNGVIKLADRLLVLQMGRVIANGPRDAVLQAMRGTAPGGQA
jgi:ATP-binding cassette subfamily C exporter for protease/lipase